MTYTPPPFATFRVNTLNLDTAYSTLLGRYKVVEARSSDSAQQTSLEVLIARTNEVIKCKTDRESQREVFNLLVNELRQIPREDREKTTQGTLFLLGALIHRYFRLIKEYDDYNGYASWTYFGTCDVTNCKLFLAIRRALQFKEIEHIPKKKFKEDDLKILDVVTIVRALEVFRDNMLIEDKEKVLRYMKYPHFAQDTNFQKYLQDIIEQQTRRGAAVLHRFKAIAFVQSLIKQIENERQQLDKDIEKWCKAIAKEYKDFNVFRTLSDGVIGASILKHVEADKSRNIIYDLYYTPLIRDNLESMDHSTLVTKIKECYDQKCNYMLFGGYALLLQQPRGLDDNLLFTLQKALGLERSLDELSKEDLGNGIMFLKEFLEHDPGVVLDCEFFGGRDKMDTLIARVEKELTKATSPEGFENALSLTC
ncbi:hypothetical protein [Legionella cincinnatiensis]|uniref:Dot/Icm secretion system substrate n=1 Tax=Legionella cincinnatiensis TaxID=28085 RepID=A0A378IHX5_9GAMM|nr:hypothetical protein [Legionella cincinnatiensis]KTC81798.1 substrate of the Dot/Icm secretion system [Legionella cincinnatiensis]STX34606.1 Dot/Icm secretion system substrate [Legionella cincinnatiensis]